MLSEYEAQKLTHEMRDELQVTPGAVIKYAAGALAILAVVVAGVFADLERGAPGDAVATGKHAPKHHVENANAWKVSAEKYRKPVDAHAPPHGRTRPGPMAKKGETEIDELTLMTRSTD
jgi:hypothetical protein